MSKHHFYILNEATLVPFLWRVVTANRPVLLFADSYLRVLLKAFDRAASAFKSWPRVRSLADISPQPEWTPTFPIEKMYTANIYPMVEKQVHAAHAVSAKDGVIGEYAYAMKKAVSDFAEKMKDVTKLTIWLEKTFPDDTWVIHGKPQICRTITGAYRDPAWTGPLDGAPVWFVPVNVLNFLTCCLAGWAWLLKRITFSAIKPENFILAVDNIRKSDFYIFDKVLDDPGDLLVVKRSSWRGGAPDGEKSLYRTCSVADVRVSALQYHRLSWNLARDLWVILRHKARTDPSLFGRFGMLAVKRAMFSAFFQKYRPRFFFGGDDYSIDHIIRNQEFRKIGGRSIGMNHGLPLNIVISQWREIDYDVYLTFGRHLYENHYKNFWPPSMAIKPAGTYRMTREQRKRLFQPRPKDIGFFPIEHTEFEKTMREAFKVARNFKDRRFYVKMKSGRCQEYMDRYRKLMSEAPFNVIHYLDPDPYELLMKISYSLCFTTLVAESIQFRVATFCLDTDPGLRGLYYRQFEGLTLSNGDAVIERIESIESGQQPYDFKLYEDLIQLDRPDVIDVIRAEIGRPALD